MKQITILSSPRRVLALIALIIALAAAVATETSHRLAFDDMPRLPISTWST